MATAAAVSPFVGQRHVDRHVGQMLGDVAGQPDPRSSPHVGDHLDVAVDVLRNTGRWANRDPDQALITASFAAQRAAR